MSGDLIDFSDESSCAFHDCKVKLDNGDELYASKAVLALSSRVLHDAITNCEENNVIALPGKSKEEAIVFLNLIYPMSEVKISSDMLPNQLAIADELDVPKVKEKCENYILSNMCEADIQDRISIENALEWCELYHCRTEIKDKCEEFIMRGDQFDLNTTILAKKFKLEKVLSSSIEELAKDFDNIRHDPQLGKLDSSIVQQIASKGYERIKLRLKALQSRLYSQRMGTPTTSAFYAMQLAQRTPEHNIVQQNLEDDNDIFINNTVATWVRRTGSSYV